jgi:3-deoxy-manno-octulosonate cytidylyltransferase (CMP-KDO synthetase)
VRAIAIIPARMGSSRFPGKPLASILGMSMLEHIYKRAQLCKELEHIYIATCNQEIKAAVESFGGQVIMTSSKHKRASDRVAEASKDLDADVIVMIQGDEPLLRPTMISQALKAMQETNVRCVNLIQAIENPTELDNINTIKTLINKQRNAVSFSREYNADKHHQLKALPTIYKQVCIIPFQKNFLYEYTEMSPTKLEVKESIDMLRILEHGHDIRCVEIKESMQAVDTPEDLKLVQKYMQSDDLWIKYAPKKTIVK